MRRWCLEWAMARENHDPKLHLVSERKVGSVSCLRMGCTKEQTLFSFPT